MKTSNEAARMPHLDGLRGVAACVVLFGHLTVALLPSLVTLSENDVHTRFDIMLGRSPLGVFWNGNSALCIFFVLSGYVISELAQTSSLTFGAQMVRRYIRLALPVLVTSAFAYALFRAGAYRNVAASGVTHSGWLASWYHFDFSARTMLREALYGTFIDGENQYNPSLWTMRAEIVGTLYVLLFNAVASDRRQRGVLYVGFMAMFALDYLPLFAVGALLHDFQDVGERFLKRISLPAFIIGCYICSLPDPSPNTALPWHLFLPPVFAFDNTRYWHSIGAIFIVTALLYSMPLQRLFGGTIGQFLGRISFILYLIQIPIICSFTAWSVLLLSGHNYYVVLLLAGGSTIVIVVALSAATASLIDGQAIALSRRAGALWMKWFLPSAEVSRGASSGVPPSMPIPAPARSKAPQI